jgi:DnaK suppressor protein
VVAKKPVKKAAKAAKKTTKPAARAVARKPVAKKLAPKKAAPGKPATKKATSKAPARKSAAGKPAAVKKAAKSTSATHAPAKKATPAHAATKHPTAKKAVARPAAAKKPSSGKTASKPMSAKSPAAKSIGREALIGPVKVQTPKQPQASGGRHDPAPKPVAKPVAKPVTKQLAQPVSAAKSIIAPRPIGKVAVAVAARPSAPPRKDKFKMVPYKNDPATGRPILPPGYRPSADEEYMNPLQVEYFRQRLLKWRADLVEESKQTIENLKDEVRDVGDEAERATRETENSLELRTRDRYRKLIGKIDSTLKRVDSGEYGYSVDSGEDIGLERLEVRLTAERTIDEQERWEHLQKQIGD